MFQPINRHILVSPINSAEKEQQTMVLLPEDYEPEQTAHCAVTVIDWANDCSVPLTRECVAIVNRSMIEEITYSDETYHVILENYVVGTINHK